MLFIISLIQATADLSKEYYIKQHDTYKYMATLSDNPLKPLLVDFELADKFKIVNSQKNAREKIIYVSKMPTHVLDLALKAIKLIYYPYRGQANQKFIIETIDIAKGTYFIKNGDLCLEYIEAIAAFELKKCDYDNKNQIFEISIVPEIPEKMNLSLCSNDKPNPEKNKSLPKENNYDKNSLKNFEDIAISESLAANSSLHPNSLNRIRSSELEKMNEQLNSMFKALF